ncbi:Acyl-CoA thioesterase FadM [Flexibacter flexilis DSM 6793]|uniref:Acyl-CoA thioesterase FadM n=2 Tax=Flexibacter flexilis TaxID=998 RepID=A0A1I1MBG1_9BACT|nr:Acyl-CoA thioesterase FadM [Flexibacter flexilis DSM 6793]
MARIKLDLPSVFSFSTEVPIRVTDLNYGGHVGNDTILSIVHEARVQYFNSLGYTELSLAGVGVIMADSAIVYKSESFHGDTLRIEVAAAEFSKYGFDLYYKLSNKATGKTVAEAKTGIVCFDYQIRKVAALPTEALEKLQITDSQ